MLNYFTFILHNCVLFFKVSYNLDRGKFMDKIRRLVDMAQPEGSFHKLVISQVDVTRDNEIVVSYVDYVTK